MHIDGIEILNDADIGCAMFHKFNRAASELKLSQKAGDKFDETLHKDVELVKKGNMPKGVVAGRLYIICLLTGQARGQQEVAQACGTTEYSVRKYYKLMNTKKWRN